MTRPALPDPAGLLPGAAQARDALSAAGWSSAALDELLGAGARSHLDKGELAPVLRRTTGGSPLDVLARLLVVGSAVPEEAARASGLPSSWLVPGPGGVTAAVRLQPVRHGDHDVVLPHDAARGGAGFDPDQVLGVGAASLTLAAATPRDPVGRVLDVGTGAGVQALLAAPHARAVVATDASARATAFAQVAAVLNGARLDVRTGDLLTPVAGEVFDLVVSNPPFVIGPTAAYTYRDAGLDGDEVSRRLVEELPAHLAPGGSAVLLANWLHVEGEDGDDRVRSWFEGGGCEGWVVQRELAAPEDYVTAWLRDTDEGERFDALYDTWLDWFTARRVEAVAFGVLALHRPRVPGPVDVVVEDVPQAVAATWGEQVPAHFAARAALRGDVVARAWRLRDDVRLHQVASAAGEGWSADVQVLQQEAGLRWSGAVDDHGAALLAGCDGSRPLGALLSVLAAAVGLSDAEAAEQVVPVVRSLVAQGFLVPA